MANDSFAARRAVSLLVRVRDSVCEALKAFESGTFLGPLAEVLTVTPEEVNAAVSYFREVGLTQEEVQQLRNEWESCWEAGGYLQVLVRNPPATRVYAEDPDPGVNCYNQALAKRFAEARADHQEKTDLQRSLAAEAASVLLKHVEDLLELVGTNQPQGTGNTTVDEANTVAMELAKKNPAFVNGGAREWAKEIRDGTGKTCSLDTVTATPFWQATMKKTGRGRTPGKAPKATTLTKKVEAVAGEGERQAILNDLASQQAADFEPSPLDNTRRKVRVNKRL